MTRVGVLLMTCLATVPLSAAENVPGSEAWTLPESQRVRYRNSDGSCVQCSIGMAGVHHGVGSAEWLLWDHDVFGPKERGGAWPERVARYSRSRGIAIYNVTGSATLKWIDWALATGRYPAITYGRAHMITAVGVSSDRRTYYVVDNNAPDAIRSVSRSRFMLEHRGNGGGWCVVLQGPAPVPWVAPKVVAWWQEQ